MPPTGWPHERRNEPLRAQLISPPPRGGRSARFPGGGPHGTDPFPLIVGGHRRRWHPTCIPHPLGRPEASGAARRRRLLAPGAMPPAEAPDDNQDQAQTNKYRSRVRSLPGRLDHHEADTDDDAHEKEEQTKAHSQRWGHSPRLRRGHVKPPDPVTGATATSSTNLSHPTPQWPHIARSCSLQRGSRCASFVHANKETRPATRPCTELPARGRGLPCRSSAWAPHRPRLRRSRRQTSSGPPRNRPTRQSLPR